MKPYLTNIRTMRKRLKLTQRDMADLLCMRLLAYQRLEWGVTALTVDRLIKIADVLKVKVRELI